MKLKSRDIILVLLGLCAIVGSDSVAQKNTLKSAPSTFAPDDDNRGFKNAMPPSDVVLDALLKTPEAVEMKEELSNRDRESLRSLFEVVRVNLVENGEKDFLALGEGPMTGADCFWFWLVRVRKGKADVLLFSNGLSFRLRTQKTNQYKNIEVDWATARFIGWQLYRYNGSVYRLGAEHTKENK